MSSHIEPSAKLTIASWDLSWEKSDSVREEQLALVDEKVNQMIAANPDILCFRNIANPDRLTNLLSEYKKLDTLNSSTCVFVRKGITAHFLKKIEVNTQELGILFHVKIGEKWILIENHSHIDNADPNILAELKNRTRNYKYDFSILTTDANIESTKTLSKIEGFAAAKFLEKNQSNQVLVKANLGRFQKLNAFFWSLFG